MPINKNIILIGSTGSIGKNLTEFLSKLKQYRLIIIDHQNSEVAKLANSLNLEYQYINLLNVGDIKEAINNVLDLIGYDIYALIFNAAQTSEGLMKEYKKIPDFPDFPKDSWDDGIQINLSSFYQICELITPYMKKSGTGKIIAVSSMYGVVAPSPALYNGQNFHCPAVYSASKAGLIGLVRWLASYLGEDNINVNCISPGGVFNNQDTEFVEKLKEKIPLKRMATKNDINGIVKFLLSDDSSYAQGHNFIIDGGYTIR